MYCRKSSAHTQQGYSFESNFMKLFRSACSFGVGVFGYVAAIEWSRVHVLRPSVSTSAGQSVGVLGTAGVKTSDDGFVCVCVGVFKFDFVCNAHAANDVQERHLRNDPELIQRKPVEASKMLYWSSYNSRFAVFTEHNTFRELFRRIRIRGSNGRRTAALGFSGVVRHVFPEYLGPKEIASTSGLDNMV